MLAVLVSRDGSALALPPAPALSLPLQFIPFLSLTAVAAASASASATASVLVADTASAPDNVRCRTTAAAAFAAFSTARTYRSPIILSIIL